MRRMQGWELFKSKYSWRHFFNEQKVRASDIWVKGWNLKMCRIKSTLSNNKTIFSLERIVALFSVMHSAHCNKIYFCIFPKTKLGNLAPNYKTSFPKRNYEYSSELPSAVRLLKTKLSPPPPFPYTQTPYSWHRELYQASMELPMYYEGWIILFQCVSFYRLFLDQNMCTSKNENNMFIWRISASIYRN